MVRKSHDLSCRHFSASVRDEHAAVGAYCNASGKQQSAASQRGVYIRRVKWNSHHMAAGEPLRCDQFRSAKSAVRTEGAAVDWPKSCGPWSSYVQHFGHVAGVRLARINAIHNGRMAENQTVHKSQRSHIESAVWPFGDAGWRGVGDNVAGKVRKDFIGPVRMHQVQRVRCGVGDINTAGQRQHRIKVGIGEVGRQIKVGVRPVIIEISDAGYIANLAIVLTLE